MQLWERKEEFNFGLLTLRSLLNTQTVEKAARHRE